MYTFVHPCTVDLPTRDLDPASPAFVQIKLYSWNHREPPLVEVVPGAPLRSRAPEPPQGNRFPEPEPPLPTDLGDPDLLVSCKSCFKPTTAGVAGLNDGLCARCASKAGLEIT